MTSGPVALPGWPQVRHGETTSYTEGVQAMKKRVLVFVVAGLVSVGTSMGVALTPASAANKWCPGYHPTGGSAHKCIPPILP